jgi:hypothetical protein
MKSRHRKPSTGARRSRRIDASHVTLIVLLSFQILCNFGHFIGMIKDKPLVAMAFLSVGSLTLVSLLGVTRRNKWASQSAMIAAALDGFVGIVSGSFVGYAGVFGVLCDLTVLFFGFTEYKKLSLKRGYVPYYYTEGVTGKRPRINLRIIIPRL